MDGGINLLFALLSRLEGKSTVRQRADTLRGILNNLELLKNLEVDDEQAYEREVRALSEFLSALEAMEMGEVLAPSGPMELNEFLAIEINDLLRGVPRGE